MQIQKINCDCGGKKPHFGNKHNTNTGMTALAAGLIAGAGVAAYNNPQPKDETLDLFIKEYNQKDTKKDSIEIKDLNKDEVPEFIIEKKDGTRVSLDLVNKKIKKTRIDTII